MLPLHSDGAARAATTALPAAYRGSGNLCRAYFLAGAGFAGAPAVVLHAVSGLDGAAIAQVQESVRRRLLRGFVRRGLLPDDDAQAMAQWDHGGGFSVDASVCIAAADRAGRERLFRYCARPPFALDRLHELDPEHLLYERTQPGPGGTGSLLLTPPQLLYRLAALIRDRAGRSRGPAGGDATRERDAAPRSRSRAAHPRVHRHRHYGVLAPNARLRAAVTALAPVTCRPHRHLRQIRLPPNWPRGAPPARPRVRRSGRSSGAVGLLAATRLGGSQRAASAGPLLSGARRYAWALLLARIYEVFPLVCPLCGAEMRIIAFITDASVIRDLLVHLGEPIAAPRVAPARGPPLWDLPAAGKGGGDPLAQPAPAYEFDQRVAW